MLEQAQEHILLVWNAIPAFYKPLRFPLYSSFFTAASLLLAVQNLLVINLNRDVYSQTAYREHVRTSIPKRILHWSHDYLWWLLPESWFAYEDDSSVYGPLKRLASYLRRSTAIVLACAVVQVAVGQFENPICGLVCLIAAAIAFIRLFMVLSIQKRVVDGWLSWLAKEVDK